MTELPSWRDTATRQAITAFVARVTDAGDPAFVPPAERIATFDNDGTLWPEQPVPIQAEMLLGRLAEQATADPSLSGQLPWKAVVEHDGAWLSGALARHYEGDDRDLQVLASALLGAYADLGVDEFAAASRRFLEEGRHATLDRPYLACAYRPMVELLDYLAANGFTCYIASGGGRDFMRTVSEELYGIPPERVIGSSVGLQAREDAETQEVTIVRTSDLDLFDDGPAKPVSIWSRTGRRPIIAAGNSNGDMPMLAFARTAGGEALRLLVRHDDERREFAYTAGADAALQRAYESGWTVVSVRDDWSIVFGD